MLHEQERKLEFAEATIRQAERDLAALAGFGWEKEIQPLADYKTTRTLLAETQAEMGSLKPEISKTHAARLTKMLDQERYYLESLIALAEATGEAVGVEMRAFHASRDTYITPINEAQAQADEAIRAALAELAEAMQGRYKAMIEADALYKMLAEAQERFGALPLIGTPTMSLPRPFPKMSQPSWPAYAHSFLTRVSGEFEGWGENTAPDVLAERVYGQ